MCVRVQMQSKAKKGYAVKARSGRLYDGRGQPTASHMLTAIMSGGVGNWGREVSTQLINFLEKANQSFS